MQVPVSRDGHDSRSAGRPWWMVRAGLATLLLTVSSLVAVTGIDGVGRSTASAAPVAHSYAGSGVMGFGDAPQETTPSGTLGSVMTAMAATPDGRGFWLAGADGGVFASGDAPFEGSLGGLRLTGPIVAIAGTPDGNGYWLAGLDGGVFAFGDAGYYGSLGGIRLAQPIVGMASTADGRGYWLVAADGGVFTFGDAGFFGSTGGMPLAAVVTGMAATADGQGYWLVAADGGIFTFGDANFLGSTGGKPIPDSIVGMATTPGGKGYWLVGWDGSIYTFGNAPPLGSTASTKPLSPVSAMAATPDGNGYWLLEPDDWNYFFTGASPYALSTSASITSIAASQVEGDPDLGQGAYCNPYGPCEAWCALFATWVWRQSGVPIPAYPFTGSMYSWVAGHGRLLAPWALAAPGDAVLYGTGPQSTASSVHTGIVAQVWPDGAIVTIEGDAGPAPSGQLSVIINGPFLPADSNRENGFPIYAFGQPTA
ncbi:MAG TPA: CHAP domain-containing protein [Acidimicrobiales bacterium]|nr:CHAP domain-containing protein [Acidimicrobiales bacterium]